MGKFWLEVNFQFSQVSAVRALAGSAAQTQWRLIASDTRIRHWLGRAVEAAEMEISLKALRLQSTRESQQCKDIENIPHAEVSWCLPVEVETPSIFKVRR